MKIKHVGWILLCLFALIAAVSCKSTPPEETTAPPVVEQDVPIAEKPSLAGLEAAEDRALAAQKLVNDFGGSSAFPDDWKAANALMTDADRRKNTSNNQEITESTARFNMAAEAYEGMSGKVLENYYEFKEAELIAARNLAISAGAEDLIPELLWEADDNVAAAVKKYEAKDYYGARDSANESVKMYEVLKSGLDAYAVRAEMEEKGLLVYDPQAIELADDTMWAASYDYSAKNLSGANDKVNAAKLRYNLARNNAMVSYAADNGAEAAYNRQISLDLRANVASRQEFNAAQDVYNRANTAFQNQRYDEAAAGFQDSSRRFESVIALTRAKRAAAEEALQRANQSLAVSDEKARTAEIILEGGEE